MLYSLSEDDEAIAIGELHRVLKPASHLIVNVAALNVLRGNHAVFGAELRRSTRRRLRAVLTRAGFEVTRLTYSNASIFPLIFAVRTGQRLMGLASPEEAGTDVVIPSAPVNAMLSGLLELESRALRVIDMPSRTAQKFELAINGPQKLLREHGWETVDAMQVSRTPDAYRRFVQESKAEFGVAKHTYVANRSGWFSDRTECYLAAGRPALVQDTGWTAHLPSGEGLLAFSNPDEAAAGIDRINSDYAAHARGARELACEHFDARKLLPRLLDTAFS